MFKKFSMAVMCIAVLLSLVACGTDTTSTAAPTEPTAAPTEPTAAPTEPTAAPTEPTENTSATSATTPPMPANGAFDTENIVRIAFYLPYGLGEGKVVPAEYMDEVTAWLGTFTVGEEATGILRPGTNTKHVEITYADGTIIKNGTDTVKINGTEYFWEKEKEPDCISDVILKGNP